MSCRRPYPLAQQSNKQKWGKWGAKEIGGERGIARIRGGNVRGKVVQAVPGIWALRG